MFKKWIVVLVGAALLGAAWADSLLTPLEVEVTVTATAYVDFTFHGDDEDGVTLTLGAPSEGEYAPVAVGGAYTLDSNLAGEWMLTAAVTDSPADAGDIVLQIYVGSDETPDAGDYEDLFVEGLATGALTLLDGVGPASPTGSLFWRATASVAGTPAGSYAFEVTFTFVSDSEDD